MLRSLASRPSRRVHAEQVRTVRVAETLSPEIDLNDVEVVQLVHDLRNQLMVMALCVDAIQDGEPHRQADRLGELQHAGERAVLLINALLTDERRQAPARTHVDVNQVVRATAATLALLQDDGIRLQLDLQAEPLAVLAARGALERVLLNLVLNAFDAMPDGGVLTIETAIAHAGQPVEGMPPGRYAHLTVRDTGCGMTAEVKERIFDTFFTTKKHGTGLGLRSVAFTVQELRGRISVESEPGRGTSVTVMFPVATETSVSNSSASGHPLDSRD